eukprot:scaffold5919_cov118-Isochrysis_galbana.AAC.8
MPRLPSALGLRGRAVWEPSLSMAPLRSDSPNPLSPPPPPHSPAHVANAEHLALARDIRITHYPLLFRPHINTFSV